MLMVIKGEKTNIPMLPVNTRKTIETNRFNMILFNSIHFFIWEPLKNIVFVCCVCLVFSCAAARWFCPFRPAALQVPASCT